MSSAILYLAIIAIWACVLIPRWLRRDSARGSAVAGFSAAPETVDGDLPAVPFGRDVAGADEPGSRMVTEVPLDSAAGPAVREPEPDSDSDSAEQDAAPPPLTPEESRRRMLAARRRLLGVLTALEGAAIMLAVFNLAALWVVIPPSVMLTGYLLLLREAAHADAERWRRDEEAAQARTRERDRTRARARAPQGGVTAAGTAGLASPASPASPAAGYADLGTGRDFAPGLAGKYTASNAEVVPIPEREDEDSCDQYTQGRLRAVGD